MRVSSITLGVVFCLWLAACGQEQEASSLFHQESDSDGVELLVERDVERLGLLVTFTPEQSKEPCHLYDTNLPLNGIAGAGRPTRVELVANPLLAVAGEMYVHEKLIDDGTDLKPYPTGPVHISVPLQLLSEDAAQHINVMLLFSYMACGETFCCPPVTQKEVQISIPREWCRPVE